MRQRKHLRLLGGCCISPTSSSQAPRHCQLSALLLLPPLPLPLLLLLLLLLLPLPGLDFLTIATDKPPFRLLVIEPRRSRTIRCIFKHLRTPTLLKSPPCFQLLMIRS